MMIDLDQALRGVHRRQAQMREAAERSRLAAGAHAGREGTEAWPAGGWLAAQLRRLADRLDPASTHPARRPAE
ncbi:MAG TPA: hypothetical protein VK131_03515 [Candidatus Acidoferrales bacterium]|nr:hypothetical protein [Candidatus Acidoferrales bacterium]